MLVRQVLIMSLLLTAWVLSSSSAQADVTLCNKSGGLLQIAIASPITEPYETNEISGWHQLRNGRCKTVINGYLGYKYDLYYFMVTDDFKVYQPDGAEGGYTFCITGEAFTRRGTWNRLQTKCPQGWVSRDFYKHTVKGPDLTITINP
jgi:uncharacterized membrane protein